MCDLLKDLSEGLQEAVDYEVGQGSVREETYIIEPVREFTGAEIRKIRMDAGMTQAIFAYYMGVSKKTVEAWEGGRTHPTGPVFRLLAILAAKEVKRLKTLSVIYFYSC